MLPAHVTAEATVSMPRPFLLGLVVVVLLAVTVVAVYVGARVGYRLFWFAVRPLRRALSLVLPEGSATLVAAALVVTAGVGGVSFLVLDADNSLATGDGVGGRAGEYLDRGLKEDPIGDLENDVYRPGSGSYGGSSGGSGGSAPGYVRPSPDTDGDRLKDSWERAGETPGGVPLPNADPMHKDLYVVFQYGDEFEALSASERQQLVDDWARMPVANPDNQTGIRLHIDDRPQYGGIQNSTLTVTSGYDGPLGSYGELGSRQCRYHLVTFASFDRGDTVGLAGVPGYTSLVDGSLDTGYGGASTRRVHVTTHELLHNVVGSFGGESHSTRGWLAPVVADNQRYLSPPVAASLNETGLRGSAYFQHEVCDTDPAPNATASPTPT